MLRSNALTVFAGAAFLCSVAGVPALAHAQSTTTTTTVQQPAPPPPAAPPPQSPPSQNNVYVNQPSAEGYAPPPGPPPVSSSPVVINAQAGHEDRSEWRPRKGLIISGATLFGVTYAVTVIGAAVASDVCEADYALGCRDAAWPIYIPIIGPFAQMGYIHGTGANTGRALLGIDGVLQAAGVTMAIVGLVAWHRGPPRSYAQKLQFSPYVGGGNGGMMVAGHF